MGYGCGWERRERLLGGESGQHSSTGPPRRLGDSSLHRHDDVSG